MASQITDPKEFAIHLSSEVLSEYLKIKYGLDFTVGDKKEKKEESANRFIDFIEKQDEKIRDRVYMEFEYVNNLSSSTHILAIYSAYPNIDTKKIEKEKLIADEKALLLFTYYQTEFNDYYSQAKIEDLPVKELTLPKVLDIELVDDKTKISSFEKMVQKIYKKSLKGDKCKITSFVDKDKLILRAFIEDLPTRDVAFDGLILDESHIRKPVFDVVFIYKTDLKMLGVRALGGKKIVSDLQKLFCKHFLSIDDIDTEEKRYKITSIKDLTTLNLIAEPSYGVERSFIKSIRLKGNGIPHKLTVDVGGRDKYSGTDAIQEILKELRLDTNTKWEIESIKITVVFNQIGNGRRKQITVLITPPNTCNLKNRKQDDIVRKLLKDWGIYIA